MTYYPPIGSVSEGTLRTGDLLDTFAWELRYHMKRMRLTREQRKRFGNIMRAANGGHGGSADDAEIVDELQDALSDLAAPYSYFGASDGDGACFGFWPCLGMGGDCDDLPKLEAGEPIAREHWGEDILLVNDHGNVTCGHVSKRGKFTEYWSCV